MTKAEEYDEREHTQVKHTVLRRYLSAAIPIVGDWAADIAYTDCLAGPWKSAAADLHDTSFDTAVQVLRSTRTVLDQRGKSPHLRCLFIEIDREAFSRLEKYTDGIKDIEAVARNWDFTQAVPKVVNFAVKNPNSFSFVFIDPKGWEQIALPLIAPILRLSQGEVLITLMTSFIRRFVKVEGKGFDKIFGATAVAKLENLSGDELEEGLVRQYTAAAKTTGDFKYACTLPVLKASQDDFQFFMVYLTRHIRGVEVFKETERAVIPIMHEIRAEAQSRKELDRTGQFSLLPPDEKYKEARFTHFRRRQLERVRGALLKVVEAKKSLTYGEAWELTMQNAAVLDADLREWIFEWRVKGLIDILGWAPRQKVPHKENVIQWRG
ncbi:MAG: three-Cys-motif partner protein TcmP [Terriglobales bacterium]